MGLSDPVPLDEPTEFAGQWWKPDDPDNVMSGRLRYDPEDGLRLDLNPAGTLVSLQGGDVPWLLGVSVDGRAIMLRDSLLSDMTQHIPGGIRAEIHVNQAFIGIQADSEQQLLFQNLEARIANLIE